MIPKPQQWIAHGCAIYTADDWRDGTNHGGKYVCTSASQTATDDCPSDADLERAAMIAFAVNNRVKLANEIMQQAAAISGLYKMLRDALSGLKPMSIEGVNQQLERIAADFPNAKAEYEQTCKEMGVPAYATYNDD